jgi:hypothetical protein
MYKVTVFRGSQIPPSNVSERSLYFDAIVPGQWRCSFIIYVISL